MTAGDEEDADAEEGEKEGKRGKGEKEGWGRQKRGVGDINME